MKHLQELLREQIKAKIARGEQVPDENSTFEECDALLQDCHAWRDIQTELAKAQIKRLSNDTSDEEKRMEKVRQEVRKALGISD
jgi:hypothetical protein